jgi:hypothetical protein
MYVIVGHEYVSGYVCMLCRSHAAVVFTYWHVATSVFEAVPSEG